MRARAQRYGQTFRTAQYTDRACGLYSDVTQGVRLANRTRIRGKCIPEINQLIGLSLLQIIDSCARVSLYQHITKLKSSEQ